MDLNDIKIGDKIKAKQYVPCLMETCCCFDKDEIATVVYIDSCRIGIQTKCKDIEYFYIYRKDAIDDTTCINTWFDIC